ncbi:lysine--tRNA ligase [Anaeromassilibacillus sp. An172]|uniref:lysine--tRNA ligase n=1 Tax=Anaeromassilibacillus sp. An172 TaxID=1965570 RepID=UPI000B3A76A4|nr:lysine--tRNA ligase [Anaeromassilibacillus sp. An172]OUP79238.1 lysine--tRNA ligase [Anaeromassilibacillus sp. An172]
MGEQNATQNNTQNLSEILQVRRDKLKALQDAGKDPFQVNTSDRDILASEILERFEELENKDVCIAGRIMSKRGKGKVAFIDIHDRSGKMQIFAKHDDLGEDEYKTILKYDIGDIIEVKGFVFRTKVGEISVHAKKITLLSKSLLPLPEKYHGLKDTDLRYRQRYVDLIMNPEVKDTFIKRSKIIKTIRSYLDDMGYIEVETPVLNTIPGGAAARPFITHHNTLDIDLYMRIAPELYLKRLIVGGMEKVYEIGRLFRNEGMDVKHNPEFTTIEIYEAYTDYNGMMDRTEQMINRACVEVNGTDQIKYQGEDIDLSVPFKRMTMIDAVKQYAGVDFGEFIGDTEKAKEVAKELKLEVKPTDTWGNILNTAFEDYVEEQLVQPTFICDYPVEVSPLTKRKKDVPELVERFELFITRRELANAYTELNDPIDQRKRFEHQLMLREAGDDEANMLDEDFLTSLEYGMAPTGGMGMGIDRLTMLLTDSASIRDVIIFPTMKPLGDSKRDTAPKASEAPKAEPEKIDFSKVEIEPLFKDYVDFETFSKSDFRAVKVLACEAVPKSKKLLKFTLDDGTGENRTILSGIHAYYEPEELVGKTCIAITNLPPRPMMGIESCGMLISAVHSEEGEEKLHLLMVDDHIPAGAKLY